MKNVTIQINPSMVIDNILSNMDTETKMEIITQTIDVTINDLLNTAVSRNNLCQDFQGKCYIPFNIEKFPQVKKIIYNANTKHIEYLVLRGDFKCHWEKIVPIIKMAILTELMEYWKN